MIHMDLDTQKTQIEKLDKGYLCSLQLANFLFSFLLKRFYKITNNILIYSLPITPCKAAQ